MQKHHAHTGRSRGGSKLEDVHVRAFVGHLAEPEDHDALVERVGHRHPKGVGSIRLPQAAPLVQIGIVPQQPIRSVLVVDTCNATVEHRFFSETLSFTNGDGRQRREQQVVEHQVHLVDHHRARKAAVELIPENQEHKRLQQK